MRLRDNKAIERLSRSVSALRTCRGPSPTSYHARAHPRAFTTYRRQEFLHSMSKTLAAVPTICSSSSNRGWGACGSPQNIDVALLTNQHASVATATARCSARVGQGSDVAVKAAWRSSSTFPMASSKALQQQQQRRGMSTTTMSEAEFHDVADMVLEMIHDVVEAALEDGFEGDFDCNLSVSI